MKEKSERRQLHPPRADIIAIAKTGIGTGVIGDSLKGGEPRKEFLKNLILKREEIERSINSLADGRRECKGLFSADEIIEELDRAELEIAAQTRYSLLDRKNRELEKIKILIQRTEQDQEFGLCEECGRPIPQERLLIVPEATRCVPCQLEMEKLESRKNLAEKSFRPSQGKKGLQWIDDDSSSELEGFIVNPDVDYLSFMDLEGTELEDNPKEENEK